MGFDLYAGAPSAFVARVSLPSIDATSLATLTRIAAEERGLVAEGLPPEGELAPWWIELFAGTGEAAARRIGQRWLREVDAETGAIPEEVDAAVESVRSIADLCRAAKAAHLPVNCVPTHRG